MTFKFDKEREKLVITKATRSELHQLSLSLNRFAKGYQFNPSFKMRVWDGKIIQFKNGEVDMGLWKECLKAASTIEVPFVIENKEDFPVNRDITLENVKEWCNEFFANHIIKKGNEEIKFFPYDYQIETVYKILKNRYCLAEVATSGGKSLIISMVFLYYMQNMNPDAKLLLIVPSLSLVSQFYSDFLNFCYAFNESNYETKRVMEVTFVDNKIKTFYQNDTIETKSRGTIDAFELTKSDLDDIKDIKFNEIDPFVRVEEIMSDKPRKFTGVKDPNVYIGTYQSLEKWDKKWFNQFDMVIVDEGHKAKATTIRKILKRTVGNLKTEYRVGLSGTFPEDNTAEFLSVQALLGPKVTQIEANTLVEKGNITPMQVNVIILNHNMPIIHKRLKSAKTLNNGSEIYNVEKKYFQESEHRMDFMDRLVKEKCKDNTMVLFHNVEYGMRIYERLKQNPDIDVFYIDGEVNGKERGTIIEEMNKTDRVKVLVSSYGTTATGLSINSIFNVIFADSFKSESLVIQAIGRALRKFNGKDLAMIYDLVDIFDPVDMSNSIYKHFLEREKFYKKRKYPYKVFKINLKKSE